MQKDDRPDFLSGLYGKDLIAYGTGNAGRAVIPYLQRDPSIKLCGVTNSRIQSCYAGTYLDTGLPMRSLQEWARLLPDATILITALRGYDEIYEYCQCAGFKKIMLSSAQLVEDSVRASENISDARLIGDLPALCLANEIRDIHKASFSEFKGIYQNKSVVVVGCGPTLNYYTQIPNAIHIGTNSSFLRENLKLDYYFLLHYVPDWCSKLSAYDFVKFFLKNHNDNSDDKFPEYIIEENKGRMFFQSVLSSQVQTNIEYYPLMGFCSVIFPAIQFALYTRPKQLFLVGCDCTNDGHFDGRKQGLLEGDMSIPMWIAGYQKLRSIANRHYPDTEIISVNPVALKGLFKDIFTESYLSAHSELDRKNCKIMSLSVL